MSIHNLLVPNNLDIFARSITVDTISVDALEVENMTVNDTLTTDALIAETGVFNVSSTSSLSVATNTITNNLVANNNINTITLNASGAIVGQTLGITGDTAVVDNLITKIDYQSLALPVGLYSGTVVPTGTTILTNVQRINNQIFYSFTTSLSVDNILATPAAITIAVSSLNISLIPVNGCGCLARVFTNGSVGAVGYIDMQTIGATRYLVIHPSTITDSTFGAGDTFIGLPNITTCVFSG